MQHGVENMPKRATSASPFLRSVGGPDRAGTVAGDRAAPRRKLTTVLSADVAGFSRLMEADEEATLSTLMSYRAAIDRLMSSHDGRLVGTAGDSVLAEFSSPVEAARCAAEIQNEFARRNAEAPQDRRLEFRIGINLGDVMVEGRDLFGDGVNIAARLQSLAEPGGILVSGAIYDQIKTKLPFHYEFLGTQKVKNIAEPVRIYRVDIDPAAALVSRSALRRRRLGWVAAATALSLALVFGLWQAAPYLGLAVDRFTAEEPTAPVSDRASLAVLPLTNQSGSENDYFSDGLTEDLISALGRFSGLSVKSWNAVAGYKDQPPSPEQLVRDLNVRYIVDGSVRRSEDRIRVTVRLSNAEGGSLLWSERYEEPIADIFNVQDRITRRVIGTLATRVSYLEQERASTKPTANLGAYDLYLRGRQSFRQVTRRTNLEAQELFEKAIALDPDYAAPYAALAGTYIKAAEIGWTEWPDRALERGRELAQTALRLNASDEVAHAALAMVYGYQRQFDLALAELDRAEEANPNYTGHQAERGWVLVLAGQWDEAIEALEDVLRYDPNPTPGAFAGLALAYYFRGRPDEAIVTLKDALGRYPGHVPLHIKLTAAYAEVGRLDDAGRSAANVRRLSPFFSAESYGDFLRHPADRERLQENLRAAGL